MRYRVRRMSKIDCRTVSKSTGLLERVVTTSWLAASVKKTEAHCSVICSAFMTAACKVVWESTKKI